MKKLQCLLVAGFLCGAAAFTACSDDSSTNKQESTKLDSAYISSKLVGKWMNVEEDGQTIPTNMRGVVTIESEKSGFFSTSFGDQAWLDHMAFDYSIKGDTLAWDVQESEVVQVHLQHIVKSIDDSNINMITTATMTANGAVVKVLGPMNVHFIRLDKDFGKDVIGLWEGKSSGEKSEFDDGKKHRWEYKADGTYIYYVNEDGEWKKSDNEYNSYFIDGTLLCTRWGADGKENREWWVVESISDGVMKWTAIRVDDKGKQYTASFEMTKVTTKEP